MGSNPTERKDLYDKILARIKSQREVNFFFFDSKHIVVALKTLGEGYIGFWNGKNFQIKINPEKAPPLDLNLDFNNSEACTKWRELACNHIEYLEAMFLRGMETCKTISSVLSLMEDNSLVITYKKENPNEEDSRTYR